MDRTRTWNRARTRLRPAKRVARELAQLVTLFVLKRRVWRLTSGSLVKQSGMTFEITDGPNFYMQYKDEFIRQIYFFESDVPNPLIIDGGSNIGMSIMYFKRLYPEAKIIGFEPDPAIHRMLQANLRRNGLSGVTLINSALGNRGGTTEFLADHSAGGQVMPGAGSTTVKMQKLSHFLTDDVDFLKLNIEGQELDVLTEISQSGRLRKVRRVVIEYHGWARANQTLGAILSLLDSQGFRYVVHDFDSETNPATKPPFRWMPTDNWFCLIYAVRA